MYLNRIEVRNFRLQGQDIIWDLNPDVNILVGYNGCGKTSLLKMVYELYKYNSDDYLAAKDEDLTFFFETSEQQAIDSITIFEGKENDYQLFKTYMDVAYDVSIDTFTNEIQLINTFDVNLSNYKQIFSELKDFPFKSSLLDLSLEKVKLAFLLSHNKIRKDLEKLHFETETLTEIEKKEISKKIDMAALRRKKFIKIVDRLFAETHKTLDTVEADFSFLDAEKNEISLLALSSGEKQLLYILLTVFLQNHEPSILLLDEPEISMHIYWQRELISIIRELNPNCQMIIATHSPTIISQGWFDNMKNWEDIISPYYSQPTMIGFETAESAQERKNIFKSLKDTKQINYYIHFYLHYLTYKEIMEYCVPLGIRSIDYFVWAICEPLSDKQITELMNLDLADKYEFSKFIHNTHNTQEAINIADYLVQTYGKTHFGLENIWRKTTNNKERKQVLDFAEKHKLSLDNINFNHFKSLKPQNGKNNR